MAFIPAPTKIPIFLQIGLWAARRVSGQDLLLARLLAWYPKAAISSGILESLIAHHDGKLDERILKMVRMKVSFTAACPFCMDMNSVGWEKLITPDELSVLQGYKPVEELSTLTEREKLAVLYAQMISSTPLNFPAQFVTDLRKLFSEREIVILASTAAQVNCTHSIRPGSQ
jgi:alkylhydroperoxidase family enzyme